MNPKQKGAFEEWLKGKPESVRGMSEKFPPGTRVLDHDGKMLYVIGYGEYADGSATIEVTEFDPFTEYEKAAAARRPLCKCCLTRLVEVFVE